MTEQYKSTFNNTLLTLQYMTNCRLLLFMTRLKATFINCLWILCLNLLDKSCIEFPDFVRVEPSDVLTKNRLQQKTSDLLALGESGDLPSGHLDVANHYDYYTQVCKATDIGNTLFIIHNNYSFMKDVFTLFITLCIYCIRDTLLIVNCVFSWE